MVKMKPKQFNFHGRAWLLACGLATGVLSASLPAKGAAVSCNSVEILDLSAPAVTVIDGPGLAADEQAKWMRVSGVHAHSGGDTGFATLKIGRTWFLLERTSP